jgi:OOP family OmpA-OmpF porin
MNAGINAPSTVLRKMIPLLILTLAGSIYVQAQQVRLGVLGGLHSSSVLETNSLPGWDSAVKKYNGSRSGYKLGFILEVPIGHSGFFLQPELTYITKGRTYKKNNDSLTALATDTIYNKATLNLGYIEIPLNITYKMPLTANRKNYLFVSAGPYASFFYSGNVTYSSLTQSPEKLSSVSNPVNVGKGSDTYKTLDLGIGGKAGFELHNWMFSAYFSRGLTSFYNAPYPGTFHHQLFGASLGLWLTSTGIPEPGKKKDTDKDGIPDDEDMCPLKPGTAKWHGCPVPDTDHDGIDDEHDSCKTVPGLARYHGCPIPDRDGDGINDEEDPCPDQAGPATNHGCPITIVTPQGMKPTEMEFAAIKKEVRDTIDFIAHNILFNASSEQLRDSSFLPLDRLAGLLLRHPEWQLTIEGYTDNSGLQANNLLLSHKRAAVVEKYLIGKGVPSNRLSAAGFGPLRPIADNSTPAGRAANRRVELKLSAGKQ